LLAKGYTVRRLIDLIWSRFAVSSSGHVMDCSAEKKIYPFTFPFHCCNRYME
jgi:hypothetical protein